MKPTLAAAGTPAASSRWAANCLIRAIRSSIRDWTSPCDGPLACTSRHGSAKLVAHCPPVSGSRTDQPS